MKRFLCMLLALLMLLMTTTTFVACDEEGGTPPKHDTHNFGEWKTVLSATCTAKGSRMRVCACGEIETEEIAATGVHDFNEDGVCRVCLHKHSFGEWETVQSATCVTKGLRVRRCACGGSETEEIAATGEHDFKEDGACRVCSHRHSFGEWKTVSPSTCAVSGLRVRACECGASEQEELPLSEKHYYDTNGRCTVCKTVAPDFENVRVDETGVRWAQDEWGTWREYDNLPYGLGYDGEPISILHWEGGLQLPEFEQTEEVDNDILSSIYKRNRAIEDRLDVELMFTSASAGKAFIQKVKVAKDSGTHDYDILAGHSGDMATLAMMGYTENLLDVENSYMDLGKPWWPSNMVPDLAIGSNLYFVTGDMSTNAIFNMSTMYFNKTLVNADLQAEAEAYFASHPHVKTAATATLENPAGGDTATNMIYEKVYAGTWTLDDFLAYCSGNYSDKTGNGFSLDDKYGFTGIYYTMSAFYGGCNLRMVEPTSDGSLLKISEDWTSARTVKLIAKLNSLYSSNDFHDYRKNTNGDNSQYSRPFANGNCLFFLGYMRYAMDYLVYSSKVPSYGILPTPKFDTNQWKYYTTLGNDITLYSIFSDFDTRGDEKATFSMLTAVIECWASEAYRKTTPVIFELSLQLKASPTQCEADMIEIVRSSIRLDLGHVLRNELSDSADEAYRMDSQVIIAAQDGMPWDTIVNGDHPVIQENLADFVTALRQTTGA